MFIRKCLIAAAMAATAVATPAAAATNARTANGRALLLLPLKLTKIDDLDFGMVVSGNSSGPCPWMRAPATALSPAA